MKRLGKFFTMYLILLLIFSFNVCSASEVLQQPKDLRDFKDPPYSYTYFNGGNCVWFAWEMAYQVWGIELPWVGDAKEWVKLDGQRVSQGDKTYILKLSDKPLVDSIMIFQPKDLKNIFDYNKNTRYGHVAWITDLDDRYVYFIESKIYPPEEGDRWHGCWWSSGKVRVDKLEGIKYLYVSEVQKDGVNLEADNNVDIEYEEGGRYKIKVGDVNMYLTVRDVEKLAERLRDYKYKEVLKKMEERLNKSKT